MRPLWRQTLTCSRILYRLSDQEILQSPKGRNLRKRINTLWATSNCRMKTPGGYSNKKRSRDQDISSSCPIGTSEHSFDVKVDLTRIHKKHYVYSHKLNKLLDDMGMVVTFQMKSDGQPGLCVRALMMFSVADNLKHPVRRCLTHKHVDDPSNINYQYS